MKQYDKFPSEVKDEIGCYVYRLIDPRSGNTFYVGKGTGDRVFEHAKGALKKLEKENEFEADTNDLKNDVILDIINSGLEVIYVIQRWGMDSKTAFEVESALIDCFSNLGLTNKINGQHHEHGVCNVNELIQFFKREPYDEPAFKYILIKTTEAQVEEMRNQGEEDPIYAATHYAWVLKLDKAKKYKYVISAVNGVVKGVYEVDRWYVATNRAPRIAFDGHKADPAIWDELVGKRVPDKYRKKGMASPTLYSK